MKPPNTFDEIVNLIGKKVVLPDSGIGRIETVQMSGYRHAVTFVVSYWYSGNCNTVTVEPNEVKLQAATGS